jgi:tRNA(fMet)-specific endonuclease VapC
LYLLDTNICIDFIDARSTVVRERFGAQRGVQLSVSAITAGELLVGPKDSEDPEGDRDKIERFLRIVDVHDFDYVAADLYAQFVQRVGMKRRSFDRLIAAHALALGLTLVTNNAKHFADVPGLKVENWAV